MSSLNLSILRFGSLKYKAGHLRHLPLIQYHPPLPQPPPPPSPHHLHHLHHRHPTISTSTTVTPPSHHHLHLHHRHPTISRYEQYTARRIPGKQAVVVMACDNSHI